jgi:peptidyl-prolyl cis-trans isomerase A (cyclophilin A)
MRSARPFFLVLGVSTAFGVAAAVSCSSSSSDAPSNTTDSAVEAAVDTLPTPRDTAPKDDTGTTTDTPVTDPLAGCTRDPVTPPAGTVVPPGDGGSDPLGGTAFTLDQALKGFPAGAGVLTAVITTEKGQIICQLDDAKAPITVANFVGLARGTRPAQKTGTDWLLSAFYDGLKWHRVVADFVIQGGDPLGTGSGGPGYDLPVENQIPEPLGTLAMAAAAVPSGSQFYIVIGSGPAAKYNVFGTCSTEVAQTITTKDHMQKIEIARCPAK